MISKTKIKARAARKENPELQKLLMLLRKQKRSLWHAVAKYLARPRKKSISVNIDKINKLTKDDETVIVPGKVVGKGNLEHKLAIAAFSFSAQARKKLEKKADIMTIPELIEKLQQIKRINARIII